MDFYTRNYLRILIFSPVIILSSLTAEHASARGGGAPNGCENGCTINEVVTTGYGWGNENRLMFVTTTLGWPATILTSHNRQFDEDNASLNNFPPPTIQEITVLGEKILDPNINDVVWYLQTLAEMKFWLNNKLGRGPKIGIFGFLKDIVEDILEEKENIVNNYCDMQIIGGKRTQAKNTRQNFVLSEFKNGKITFDDIKIFGGDSDQIVVVFKNGMGTYTYNPIGYGRVTETQWVNLRVGCIQ
ncbi:MAG: hypothetical protein P8O06_00215 [Porticoccaceae bacterium]|nr:hypothetical protein [Porticoccaceae bacterium]